MHSYNKLIMCLAMGNICGQHTVFGADEFQDQVSSSLHKAPRQNVVRPQAPQELLITPAFINQLLSQQVTTTSFLDIGGFSTQGDGTVGGNLNVDGLLYQNGQTVAPHNILYVQKGTITAPNQFNSINAALNYIQSSGSGPNNTFLIEVGPGTYIEPELILQQYVTIYGSGGNTTIVTPMTPQQHVFVGAPNSVIRDLAIVGAGPGYAGVSYNNTGVFILLDLIFGSNDTLLSMNNPAQGSILVMSRGQILSSALFSSGVSITTSSVTPILAGAFLVDVLWHPVIINAGAQFITISGPNLFCLGSGVIAGPAANSPEGIGVLITNGATGQFINSNFLGFNTAFSVPAIGAAPTIILNGVYADSNIEDVNISHPLTQGSINASMSNDGVIINPQASISIFLVDPQDGSVSTQGSFRWGENFALRTDISPLFNAGWNTGLVSGGSLVITPGSLVVTAASGVGYLMTGVMPQQAIQEVVWNTPISTTVSANSDSFIYVDQIGTLQSAGAIPQTETVILLGKVRSTANDILYAQEFPTDALHGGERITNAVESAFGVVYISGSITTTDVISPQLDVTQGSYIYGSHQYNPSGGSPISFSTWLRDAVSGYDVLLTSTTDVDVANYDNGGGTLTPIPTNEYARHVLYIAGDGIYESYLFLYGQATYVSLNDAENAALPATPSSWYGNIAHIASIIVNGSQIVEIRDERPRPAFLGSSVAGVTIHGNLSGLLADDHPQYLRTDGARTMTGNLNTGGNSIILTQPPTAPGQVDGVVVYAHAARHLPLGQDPLATAAPVAVQTTNQIGVQNAFARADHVHAHGQQTDPTLHALVTQTTAGFMSATDKSNLDSIVSSTADFVQTTGSSMTGDLIFTQPATIQFDGSSGAVTLAAPNSAITSYSLLYPTAQGTAGQYLSISNAITGQLAWTNPAVLSVGVTSPIQNTGTATNPVIALPQANTSTSGYLSSTDWNTFNSKLNSSGGTLTGGLTLSSGNLTLNNGTVSLNGGNGVIYGGSTGAITIAAPNSAITSYSLLYPTAQGTAGQYLSISNAITGQLAWTNPAVLSVGVTSPIQNTGTATNPVIALPQANTSTSGYLSSADWNTFNSKLNLSGGTLSGGLTISSGNLGLNNGTVSLNGGNGVIYGGSSGAVTLAAPNSAITSYSLLYPTTPGTAGQYLAITNAITGQLAWTGPALTTSGGTINGSLTVTPSVGTAISVTGSASAPAVSITAGTGQIGLTVTGAANQNVIAVSAGSKTAPAYSTTIDATTGLYFPQLGQFSLCAGSVDKVKYDGVGVQIASNYCAYVYRTAALSLSANIQAALAFDTKLFDDANCFSVSGGTAGTYTVPVTGTYLVVAGLSASVGISLLGSINLGLLVNNAITLTQQATGFLSLSLGGSVSLCTIVKLTQGQTLQVVAQPTALCSVLVGGSTYFGIHLLSV